MAQQTALEWFLENIQKVHKIDWDIVFFHAKEMEKQQMIEFAETMPTTTGITQEGRPYVQYDAEKHYNETFNK